MQLTRRQLIKGTLAALAVMPVVRPQVAHADNTLWWLEKVGEPVKIHIIDQPDRMVYGYLDEQGRMLYFEGKAARREMSRQAALGKPRPYFVDRMQP